jgi:hypothetical protein
MKDSEQLCLHTSMVTIASVSRFFLLSSWLHPLVGL